MTPAFEQITGRFPAHQDQPWQALVEKVLKGADLERRLVSRTADGLRLEPLARAARDGVPILGQRVGEPWDLAVRVDHPDPVEAASLALADLAGGADQLVLVSDRARSARGFGLPLADVDRVDQALSGVLLDVIRLRLEPGETTAAEVAATISALLARRSLNPEAIAIDFGFDPIGLLMTIGDAAAWSVEARSRLTQTIGRLRSVGSRGPFLGVDVRPVHEAGGSEAQEIAAALATTACYVRLLAGAGFAPAEAFGAISMRIAVDADQLLTIAKLRALRLTLDRMREACGVTPAPVVVHAETAWRMLTRRDCAVNMLRATIAAFAAGVGGADSITVLPHTSAHGLPDAAARRLARTTQLVLRAESGLARVADPAAGAGSLEALTDALAHAGWTLFQEIERAGGIAGALVSGLLQSRIGEVRDKRRRDVATRRLPLTGTSEFPLLAELPVTCLAVTPVHRALANDPALEPLPSLRLALPFEVLRDRADAYTRAKGHPPRMFIAGLGPQAEHATRSLWIGAAIAAAGIESIQPTDGFTQSVDVGRAFGASGAGVACITGSDETCALLGEATAGALKAAGARYVLLAGRPGVEDAALTAAGVDGYLYAGQDLADALARILDTIGA